MSEETKYLDVMDRYMTAGLFIETFRKSNKNEYKPVYTLKGYPVEKDGVTYPSAKAIYMECSDPSEYRAAMAIVGSWQHWLVLRKNPEIAVAIDEWREELEVKLRSEALTSVRNISQKEDGSALNAAKYIAEYAWTRSGKRGRPTSDEVNKEKRKEAAILSQLERDAERMKEDV